MTLEHRLAVSPIEVRAAEGQPTVIAGYGAVFGSETVIAGVFREQIAPGAFRKALAQADIRGTFDHELVLGRTTNQTLRLSEDERGLRYEIEPNPKDSQAMDAVARIQRGDVTGSSFGFRVAEGGETWTRSAGAGQLPLRVITEFELIRDVGPVSFPAYEETTAEARSAARAAAAMTPGAAEEAGEAIQFVAMKDLLDQVTALTAKVAPIVDALIADNGPSDDTADAEVAEEEVEQARYAVLRAHVAQLAGAVAGLQSLACNLSYGGYGYYSAPTLATLRAEVDLIEVS